MGELPQCNCGANGWELVHSETYTGHKHTQRDDDRRKRIYECNSCGDEGRVFDKGPSGKTVYSKAMRA